MSSEAEHAVIATVGQLGGAADTSGAARGELAAFTEECAAVVAACQRGAHVRAGLCQ